MRACRSLWALAIGLLLFVLVTAPTYAQAEAPSGATAPAATSASAPAAGDYILGIGDKVHVSVFGQSELDGDYDVDSTGNVQLPLIGEVPAAGKSLAEFQKEITVKYSNGFFVNPSVTVNVANYRPFYIIGEVNKPGEYPYVNGMSVLNAVALAGGYTFRADDSEVYIRRHGSNKEVQYPADETTKIDPGDIIRVPERFF